MSERFCIEKALKRYIKMKKIGFSLSLVVNFLITGTISNADDNSLNLKKEEIIKKIHENKTRINEIEQKLKDLELDIAFYERNFDEKKQFFFPITFEHRHSKKISKSFFNDSNDNTNPDEPDQPDKPIEPDKIEISISDKSPTLENTIIDNPLDGIDLDLNDKIFITKNPDYSNINIKEKKLNLSEINFDHSEPDTVSKNVSIKVDGSKPSINTTDVAIPEKLEEIVKTFNPDTIENPETFEVTDITAPKTGELKPLEINIVGFGQGYAGYDPSKFDSNNQVVMENYDDYDTLNENFEETEVGITFSDLNINYSVISKNKAVEDFMKNMFVGKKNGEYYYNAFSYTSIKPRDSFANIIGESYGAKEGAFISDTKSSNTLIKGKYNINYTDGNNNRNGDIRYFYSFNPAGIGNKNYDISDYIYSPNPTYFRPKEDKYNIKTGTFQGTLNLYNTSTKNYLVGLDNQIWDQKLNGNDNGEITEKYKKTYTSLINNGEITIKDNGSNTIAISISVERSGHSQYKLVNHKTINQNLINIDGDNSIGISFEGKTSSYKGYLRHDLYSGRIMINGDNNYGIRIKNFYSNTINNDTENNSKYYDYSRIYGTSTAILEETNLEKNDSVSSTIEEFGKKQEIEIGSSEISLTGNNNVGVIISQGLSSNAELYQQNGKYFVKEDLIQVGNKKLVNPIANLKGLNIMVKGKGNIGFLRAKDYSSNNTADMIIREDVTANGDYDRNGLGAISKIGFKQTTSGTIGNSTLIRTDNGGITLRKNLDADSIGGVQTSTSNGNIEHNIVLQATASKLNDNIVAGKITNEAIITTSKLNENKEILPDNSKYSNGMIGMMANDNEEFSNTTLTLDNNKIQATITNKGTIALTGDNNIGMAVLGQNKGEIIGSDDNKAIVSVINRDGSTATSRNYNIAVYNEGEFSIENADITSSSGNGIGVYNNNGTVSFNGENIIKTTEGAVGIYSSGGTINQDGTITIKADGSSIENSGGIGVYGTNKANISLKNADITVNGNSGIVALDGSNITINGGTISYTGKGYALFIDKEGKINITSDTTSGKSSSLVLDDGAFGMKLDLISDGNGGYKESPINLKGLDEIKVNSNDVVVFNLVSNDSKEADFKLDNMISQLSSTLGKITGNENILGIINHGSKDINNFKIVSIDGGSLDINKSIAQSDTDNFTEGDPSQGNIKNLGFLYFKRFLGQRMNIAVGDTDNKIVVVNSTMSDTHTDKYFNGEVVGLEANSSDNAKSNEETSITLKNGAQVIANRLDISNEKTAGDKTSIGLFTNYGKITLETGSKVVVEGGVDSNGNIQASATEEDLDKWNELDSTTHTDKVIDNGIGIYATNGTEVNTKEKSDIAVFGNNTIGIYGTAYRKTEDGKSHGVEFTTHTGTQGNITINHSGNIDVSKTLDENGKSISSKGTIGIYAENNNDASHKDYVKVTNSGNIVVGDEKSTGIFVIGGTLTNTGNITVGTNSIGIYADNSEITGEGLGTITLGDNSTGILLTQGTSLDATGVLTLKTNDANSTSTKTGVNYSQEKEKEYTANYSIDMSEVKNGNAIVTNDKDFAFNGDSNNKFIKVNGENSKGIFTKDGNITIGEGVLITLNKADTPISNSSIGIYSAGSGKITNNGTIEINSDNGIGIHSKAENIKTIGTIKLNSDSGVALYLKNDTKTKATTNLTTLLTNNNITFGENSKNSIGIYADNENITVGNLSNEGKGTDNIMLVADNSVITANGDTKLEVTGKNTGVQLKNSGSYKGNIVAKNGAIGIHMDGKENSYSGNIQASDEAIGVYIAKNGGNIDSKEIKVNNGAIGIYTSADLTNTSSINVENSSDKDTIGIFADGSNVTYSGKNSITLSGNSIGIFSHTDGNSKGSINLSGTIVATEDSNNSDTQSIGIYSDGGKVEITDSGKINLKGDSSIGVYSKGEVKNSGEITITENPGIGVYLSGENAIYNGENGKITTTSTRDNTGIAIYLKDGAKLGENIGKISLSEKDIAIFTNGSSIVGSSDKKIKLDSSGEENSNIELIGKTDQNNIMIQANSGSKQSIDLSYLDINLGKNSMGIYAEDSGVKLSNVSITALKDNSGTSLDDSSYSVGVYLQKLKNSSDTYSIDSSNINIKKGMGIFLGAHSSGKNKLNLTNSEITVSSISSGSTDEKEVESGFGVYVQKNGELTSTNTTYNITSGVGVYGGEGSNIKLSNGKINFKGYNIGVFSNGGDISIDGTNLTFTNGNNKSRVTGSVAFSKNGNITNSAKIDTTTAGNNVESFTGIIGVYDTKGIYKTITNTGDILINGIASVGISAIGSSANNSIKNSGNISISTPTTQSDESTNKSMGIYSTGANIENSGNIALGDNSIGIGYSKEVELLDSTKATSTIDNSGKITINGKNSTGLYLEGGALSIKNSNIEFGENADSSSIGIYANGFSTSDLQLGNLSLGKETTGMYLKNSDVNVSSGTITGAEGSVGIHVSDDSKITIDNIGIDVKDKGIGIYNTGSLTLNNLTNLKTTGNGTLIYSVGGTTQLKDLVLNLEKGTGIVLKDNSSLEVSGDKNITVQNGATGIAFISQSNNVTSVNNTKISLKGYTKNSNDDAILETIGIVYQDSNNFDNKYNLSFENSNNFGVVLLNSSGNLNLDTNFAENSSDSVGVLVKDSNDKESIINGTFTISGKDNIGIASENSSLKVDANLTINSGVGIVTTENGKLEYSGENLSVGENSIGIYAKDSTVTNSGTINVTNDKGVGVFVEGKTGSFSNTGNIKIDNGATGVIAKDGAIATNEKDGTIDIGGTHGTASNLGMVAIDGGMIKNLGTINVNSGIGMYVEGNSSLDNSGTINVNNGYGLGGTGEILNKGTINITKPGDEIYTPTPEESEDDTIIIENNLAKISSSFKNIGGNLNSEYDLELNNPTIDITASDNLGFNAPSISGDIKLDSKFALTGNGYSFEFKDFLPDNSKLDINTSPLFKPTITNNDVNISKVPYKDVIKDSQYDNLYDGLDELLEKGVDADILKNINNYLDGFGSGLGFENEYTAVMNSLKGSIYSNIQSRVQDINRSFDNSFNEMETSYNLTRDTDKFSLIYTNGDYKNSNADVPSYDYNITGLMYMKEYDGLTLGDKYGYSFGFSGSNFKFDDYSNSKEKVYSLRTGLHNVKAFSKTLNLLTRADIGYNYHDVERRSFGSLTNKADIHSYSVSLENSLRKTLYKDSEIDLKAYTALDLEYGGYRDFKESGSLKLKVEANDYFKSELKVGTNLTIKRPLTENYSFKVSSDVAYSYDFGNNYDNNKAKLKDSSQGYYHLISEEKTRDKMGALLKIGVEKNDHFEVGVEGEYSKDFKRFEDYWKIGVRVTYKLNN